MKLNLEQIKKITKGVVCVEEKNNEFVFHRFTREQEYLYSMKNPIPDLYEMAISTAGVKLEFKTNSTQLFVTISAEFAITRSFFSLDVLVDGKPIGYLDNFSTIPWTNEGVEGTFPLGIFSKNFELGEGEKRVSIYLPYTIRMKLLEISLDDNSYIEAIQTEKKMISFGDSITHGYDGLRPSKRYAGRLAESLGVEEICKAVGGGTFFPELATLKDDFIPKYIIVAYGTNDWSHSTKECFVKDCNAFYKTISKSYPDTKIFAISPIWRKDCYLIKPTGLFSEAEKIIALATKELDNVTLISGLNLVPKDENYYGDLRLHPNDKGFEYYFENLSVQLLNLNCNPKFHT